MLSKLLLIFLPCVWGALPSKNSTEESYTWESFQKFTKSSTNTVVRLVLRDVLRKVSESGLRNDCENDLLKLLLNAGNMKSWAMKMLDASGKIPSGILDGTVMDFGSYDECLKIKVMDTSKYSSGEKFRGRYCMVGYHSPLLTPLTQKTPDGKTYLEAYGSPPDWAEEILRRAAGYLKRTAFWFGTCVPSTCTEDDVIKLCSVAGAHVDFEGMKHGVEFKIYFHRYLSTPKGKSLQAVSMFNLFGYLLTAAKPLGFNVSVSDCQIDEPFTWPYYSIAAVVCLGCLTSLCAIGTFVDSIYRWRTMNSPVNEPDHWFLKVLKAFSVLANIESLFGGNSGGGNLACFNGIRFLSATWIILGHTYFYTDTWKYLKYRHLLGFEEQFNGYLPVAVIENFTIPVGSFFFMSGFLLVYTTWKALEKNGQLNLLKFFIHKFWRMTPALGLTVALLFSLPLIDSGPIWNSTLKPQIQRCVNLWWTNFLYINNWWNTDEYCLIHTWYLAALMQFHLMGVVLLIITYRWPVIGIFFGSLLTVACTTVTAFLVVKNNFPMPAPGHTKDMDVIEDYNSQIYIKPFAHFTTYLIGMVIGYIFLKYHDRKIAPMYQTLGWFLSIMGAVLSVYGLYGPSTSIAVRVMYIIGHRIGWALSIGWMCYACATGIGGIVNRMLSWNAMYPLGQLSYLAYLLHPLVIIYRNASLRERVYYGHTELVFSFLSNIMMSLFLAFVGYIAVEIPFAILEKMIFKRKSNLKTECDEKSVSKHPIGALSP